MAPRASAKVIIRNQLGLHARPATLLADVAAGFAAAVTITRDDERVDGKSIMHLMMLAATRGTELHVTAEGPDAQACIDAIVDLVNRGFDED